MDTVKNEGYTIIESVSMLGTTFVLGEHSTAPAKYVTWEHITPINSSDYFHAGHYFYNIEAARQDMLVRAAKCLPENEYDSLAESLLSPQKISALISKAREDDHLEDIYYNLVNALETFGIEDSGETADILINNERFKKHALRLFYNIDHSAENEALQEGLEDIIKDKFSNVIPSEVTSSLKISPEEMTIMNDILNITSDEVLAKYGPYEDGNQMTYYQDMKSPKKEVTFCLTIEPKKNEREENSVYISLLSKDPYQPDSDHEISLHNIKSLEQVFCITDKDDFSWKLDLHADERLRRTGREYIFNTDAEDELYQNHNGETCTVVRMLTSKENDMLYSGLMWKAQFKDGTLLDVFDRELMLPPNLKYDLIINPEQKKPLLRESLYSLIKRAEQVSANNISPASPCKTNCNPEKEELTHG